jgi:hypothetical protein
MPLSITNNNKEKLKTADKCSNEDINNNYASFDIFSDTVLIASNDDMFLSQIYELDNINDVVNYLSNEFDELPIYTQRRLLKSIFNVYYKYTEFPKKIFIKKLIFILENIYKIKKINVDNISEELDKIIANSLDLYLYFYNKYNKI